MSPLSVLLESTDVFDQSWSFHETGVEHRLLLGWLPASAPREVIAACAADLGMSAAMVDQWSRDAQTADGLGMTLVNHGRSIRLYVQHWDNVSREDVGEVVYRGYKQLPDGAVRVDEYRYEGDLRETNNLEVAQRTEGARAWIDRVIELCPADIPIDFCRIQNAGRSSWLATARLARLDAGAVLGADFSGRRLLHLAGGVDASKGEFATAYVKASRYEAARLLGLADAELTIDLD